MKRALKTFLLWLLVAALPMQGIAAAVQMSCGPAAHPIAAEAVHAQSHHHEGDDAADSMTGVAAKSASDPADSKHKSSVCSACAACCVGAVAPPSGLALTPAYSSSLPEVFSPTPLVTGFIPAGPERPPKRITA